MLVVWEGVTLKAAICEKESAALTELLQFRFWIDNRHDVNAGGKLESDPERPFD